MGLCKCPKRKVTNLFCFEHRVNVCEHCLVSNHERCIVKSYLLWLQDSDHLPVCSLCNRSLSDEECGECIRLTCYDVFHWVCLHNHCRQLPATTAPAGYTCPSCNTCIFPPVKLATPVAQAVRHTLQQVNWARAGLGLPLNNKLSFQHFKDTPALKLQIDEDQLPPPPVRLESHKSSSTSSAKSSTTYPESQSSLFPASATLNTVVGFHSIFNTEDTRQSTNPRKWFDSTKDDGLFTQRLDHDDNKYKRRPAFQWLADWFRFSSRPRSRGESSGKRRVSMFLIICLLSFITLIIVLSQLSRHAADDDPFLDPMNNPNIKVEQKLMEIN